MTLAFYHFSVPPVPLHCPPTEPLTCLVNTQGPPASPQPVLPGMQPLSSRLCCRNAGRERGRPSRRPTARTDKAAFLLPPLPAERAACSAVGSGEGSKCQGVGLGYHPTARGPRAPCAGLPTQPRPPGRQKPLSSPGTAKSLTWEDAQPH